MNLLVQVLQPFSGNVRINLCAGQIGMAEHDLNAPEICPVFEEVGGKRVPQCVWRDILANGGLKSPFLDDIPERLTAH
jgi:hypothetical protein